MNTIAAVVFVLAPVHTPSVTAATAALERAADARAAQLADARIADELTKLSDRRTDRYASIHSPDLVRPPVRFASQFGRTVPFGG